MGRGESAGLALPEKGMTKGEVKSHCCLQLCNRRI